MRVGEIALRALGGSGWSFTLPVRTVCMSEIVGIVHWKGRGNTLMYGSSEVSERGLDNVFENVILGHAFEFCCEETK